MMLYDSSSRLGRFGAVLPIGASNHRLGAGNLVQAAESLPPTVYRRRLCLGRLTA